MPLLNRYIKNTQKVWKKKKEKQKYRQTPNYSHYEHIGETNFEHCGLTAHRVGKQVVIIDDGHIRRCDHFAGKPAAVKSVDSRHGCRDCWTLDIHVAL